MAAQSETPLYEMPVLTLKAIAEKMAAMDKEVIFGHFMSINQNVFKNDF
jgi:hypothetical protein